MQAEKLLDTQCTCSCYIELSSRAPPSRLQSGGGGQLVSQLFYSLLRQCRHHLYCSSLPPLYSPLPSFWTCFFHLLRARVERRGKLHVAAVAIAPLGLPWWIVFSLLTPCFILYHFLGNYYYSPFSYIRESLQTTFWKIDCDATSVFASLLSPIYFFKLCFLCLSFMIFSKDRLLFISNKHIITEDETKWKRMIRQSLRRFKVTDFEVLMVSRIKIESGVI